MYPLVLENTLFLRIYWISFFSDIVDMVILVGKYHIYTLTWKKYKPSFNIFHKLCDKISKFAYKYFKVQPQFQKSWDVL